MDLGHSPLNAMLRTDFHINQQSRLNHPFSLQLTYEQQDKTQQKHNAPLPAQALAVLFPGTTNHFSIS
jgi:hypothetical protein